MKLYNFRGELTDISAKKEALVATAELVAPNAATLATMWPNIMSYRTLYLQPFGSANDKEICCRVGACHQLVTTVGAVLATIQPRCHVVQAVVSISRPRTQKSAAAHATLNVPRMIQSVAASEKVDNTNMTDTIMAAATQRDVMICMARSARDIPYDVSYVSWNACHTKTGQKNSRNVGIDNSHK